VLQTEVKVRDNSPFVLGGLKRRESVELRQGVPVLKDIPIIQYLFSVKKTTLIEREVLIFIKPSTSVRAELDAAEIERVMQQYKERTANGVKK
jgi:type II secretory pathway component GspD/PulD (secretin)